MRLFSRLFGNRQAAQAAASPTMISLVILLREALLLNRVTVEMALDDVFPGKFVPRNEDSFVVDGPSSTQLMVKSLVPSHSGLFLIIFPAERYFDPAGLDSSAWDPKTFELVRKHRAWLSIDRIAEIGPVGDAYRFIGKALAKLAPEAPLAVMHPQRNILVPFDADTRTQLQMDLFPRALGVEPS